MMELGLERSDYAKEEGLGGQDTWAKVLPY